MLIVLIATEWGTCEGGINSFNYSFASALAKICGKSDRIICAVTSVREGDQKRARQKNVELLKITSDGRDRPSAHCHREIEEWLANDGWKPGETVIVVGHDCITGMAAVKTAHQLGGKLTLIHHMAYEQYQNLGGGEGTKTGDNYHAQIALFSSKEATLFGIGSYLAENARILGGQDAYCLVPGFPEGFTSNSSSNDDLRIIVAGRFTEETETLKQVELAVEALGESIRQTNGRARLLINPTMMILGVDKDRIKRAKLEVKAANRAGRHVNIIPMPFENEPKRIRDYLQRANLAIVPSYHEGFGLVGWEAIGCEVPLILGKNTGLYKFIESQLGTTGIKTIDFKGGTARKSDVRSVANAIIEIAGDLDRAKQDARNLRRYLKNERGCTWEHAARDFLKILGLSERPLAPRNSASMDRRMKNHRFVATKDDFYERCVELSLSVGQGSNAEKFDVLAELRFGTAPIAFDEVSAEISLRKAEVNVYSTNGTISGPRLGDSPTISGIEPRAGGIWIVSDPQGGNCLSHKALGDEPLCQIETSPNSIPDVTVEVLVSKKDLSCSFDLTSDEKNTVREKVMSIFLQKAVFKKISGQILFSRASIKLVGEND